MAHPAPRSRPLAPTHQDVPPHYVVRNVDLTAALPATQILGPGKGVGSIFIARWPAAVTLEIGLGQTGDFFVVGNADGRVLSFEQGERLVDGVRIRTTGVSAVVGQFVFFDTPSLVS